MKKLIFATIIILSIVTCNKSAPDARSSDTSSPKPKDSLITNASLIGNWKLLAFQNDGGSGDTSWHPADTIKSFVIFKSDSGIFQSDNENDTFLYKITEPGIFYLYRGLDSFRFIYTASDTLLTLNNAYCSEACGDEYIRVQ
jgi:hypothetical protein